jgi:hypothetical protein
MRIKFACIAILVSLVITPKFAHAQVDEDQLGSWFMLFWNKSFDDSRWGLQGDVQYRDWDSIGDMEQLLIRGGLTYSPESFNATFTLGYASITTGEFGDSNDTSQENRFYQEMLLPQKLGSRVYLRHRFRAEQRWVENQNFRTRARYALFIDIPLNQNTMDKGAWYLSFYNEVFLNFETDIGDGRNVETFDRNRFYAGVGYALKDNMRFQFGLMHQSTDTVDKTQLQFSVHQAF